MIETKYRFFSRIFSYPTVCFSSNLFYSSHKSYNSFRLFFHFFPILNNSQRGGWAGWGAVKTLCQCAEIDAHVILLDVLPDPTGKIPYLSKSGKPVEAGTRGFWKDYPNINALCKELGLDEHDVFTPFTNSSFYS
jgi:hypothetical protein